MDEEAQSLYDELVQFYNNNTCDGPLTREQCFKEFSINGEPHFLNLLNLTSNEKRPKELWQVIHYMEDHLYKKEDWKNSEEFLSLNYLLVHYPQYKFIKTEQPDFILWNENDKNIGVEVTFAGSPIIAQSNKIAKRNFGRNRNAEEVSEYIVQKHKSSANKIDFTSIENIAILGTSDSTRSLSAYIVKAVKQKIKKAHKYQNTDLRWLLIDVDGSPSFQNRRDAQIICDQIFFEFNEIKMYDLIIVQNVLNKSTMFIDCESKSFSFISNCSTD